MRYWIVSLFAIVLGGCASSGATGGLTRSGPKVLQVVQAHSAAFNRHDVGGMLANVAHDIEWYSVEGDSVTLELQGREELRNAMFVYFAETPSFRSEIESVAISGAYVSVRERASWKSGDGELSQTALCVFEVRDGVIRRVWYFPAER